MSRLPQTGAPRFAKSGDILMSPTGNRETRYRPQHFICAYIDESDEGYYIPNQPPDAGPNWHLLRPKWIYDVSRFADLANEENPDVVFGLMHVYSTNYNAWVELKPPDLAYPSVVTRYEINRHLSAEALLEAYQMLLRNAGFVVDAIDAIPDYHCVDESGSMYRGTLDPGWTELQAAHPAYFERVDYYGEYIVAVYECWLEWFRLALIAITQ